jgi:hypothetical protein
MNCTGMMFMILLILLLTISISSTPVMNGRKHAYRNIPWALVFYHRYFSLRELQNLYEVILNTKMDRRNFRKKIFSMDFLIDINELEQDVPHRPGKLYKFNYEKDEKSKMMSVDRLLKR